MAPHYPNPNPYGLNPQQTDSTPVFVDIDDDGDLDAFTGSAAGGIYYFENNPVNGVPVFGVPYVLINPFNLTPVDYGHLAFVDINGDQKIDVFIGDGDGDTNYFENIGTVNEAKFDTPQANPFGLQNMGSYSAPTFFDYDNDGKLDAFIGSGSGNTYYFKNITTDPTNPQFASAQVNPFGITKVGSNSTPAFYGLVGPKDLFIGSGQGITYYFQDQENTLLGGAGGQKPFAIAAGDGTVNISNFGGVGTGVNPAAAVIAEVDTLQFTGADLTPENLRLTQQGNDLELSFEGVADTKVVLGNFALEDLDNLSQDTGAVVDLGNILFDGQSQTEDSIDVFNADWQRQQVFHRNSVTFLNDLDNKIQGFNRSDDVINGQGGKDWLNGRSGDDLLRGGDGRDKLTGGKGDDILVGGEDDDLLNGGRGKDVFVLAADTGTDRVKDFHNGKDYFGLAGGLTFNQLTITQSNSNTLISITDTNEVLASLTGVNANLIGVGDFAIV